MDRFSYVKSGQVGGLFLLVQCLLILPFFWGFKLMGRNLWGLVWLVFVICGSVDCFASVTVRL